MDWQSVISCSFLPLLSLSLQRQGALGDCWFIGALAAISTKQELLDIVIPASHNGSTSGIYPVRYATQAI